MECAGRSRFLSIPAACQQETWQCEHLFLTLSACKVLEFSQACVHVLCPYTSDSEFSFHESSPAQSAGGEGPAAAFMLQALCRSFKACNSPSHELQLQYVTTMQFHLLVPKRAVALDCMGL